MTEKGTSLLADMMAIERGPGLVMDMGCLDICVSALVSESGFKPVAREPVYFYAFPSLNMCLVLEGLFRNVFPT